MKRSKQINCFSAHHFDTKAYAKQFITLDIAQALTAKQLGFEVVAI